VRNQDRHELFAMVDPAACIGDSQQNSTPRGSNDCPFDVLLDRSDQCDDCLRLHRANAPAEPWLSFQARVSSCDWFHPIDRLKTRVDQIAARISKHGEEVLIVDGGVDLMECIANCAIKPRIAMVEEAS